MSAAAGKARALGPRELASKVQEYEAFANDVLRKKLDAVTQRRRQLEAERDEWVELQRGVTALHQEGRREVKSLVDLGSGVHCQAAVPDATRICVSVGLGFHVECTLEEAARVAEARAKLLQDKIGTCVHEAAQVRVHLRFVMQAIGELQQLSR